MNALGREIKKGEKVVLKRELFKPEFQDLATRTVVVTGGFGMRPHTSGTALYVKFSDGEESRFEGDEISVDETNAL